MVTPLGESFLKELHNTWTALTAAVNKVTREARGDGEGLAPEDQQNRAGTDDETEK